MWRKSTWWLWLRALVYLGVVAGGWLVVLPALLLVVEHGSLVIRLRELPWMLGGACVVLASAALGLTSGYYLISRGHGTPLPLDPTRALVTAGPYHFVRNPQGIAMMLAVVGEGMLLDSRLVWVMVPLTLMYLEVLVGPWEERQLSTAFGKEYEAYKRRVRKWLPRLTRQRSAIPEASC